IARSNGHVQVPIPFISQTGDLVPEYYVFSIGLTISGIMFSCTVVVVTICNQLKLNKDQTSVDEEKLKSEYITKSVVNVLTLIFGFTSSIGLIILACFNLTNYFTLHQVGLLLFRN